MKVYYQVNNKYPDTHIEEDPTVGEQSQIKTCVTVMNRERDPMHIDFLCPTETCSTRTAYSSLLDNELVLRKNVQIMLFFS